MKVKIGKLWKQQEGQALVLFALCLVVLLAFASLAIDIGAVSTKKANMMDLCQQMRRARLDAKDYIMNANDPAKMIYDISNQCARDNGFRGGLSVYYEETAEKLTAAGTYYPSTDQWVDKRTYRVRIELTQKHKLSFIGGSITGWNNIDGESVTVFLDGSEQKTSKSDGGTGSIPVWYHGGSPKNKKYSRSDLTGDAPCTSTGLTAGNRPADW